MKKIELGKVSFVNFAKASKGTTIEGIYRGSKQGKYTLEHTIDIADGTRQVLNGTGKLNVLLSRVSEGSPIKLTYLGKVTSQSGASKGKDVHDFELYDMSPEESAAPAAAAASNFKF